MYDSHDASSSSADVARRSCSSAPLIPDVGISRATFHDSSATRAPFDDLGHSTLPRPTHSNGDFPEDVRSRGPVLSTRDAHVHVHPRDS